MKNVQLIEYTNKSVANMNITRYNGIQRSCIGGTITAIEGNISNPEKTYNAGTDEERERLESVRRHMVGRVMAIDSDTTRQAERQTTILKLDNFDEEGKTRTAYMMDQPQRLDMVKRIICTSQFGDLLDGRMENTLRINSLRLLNVCWDHLPIWIRISPHTREIGNNISYDWCYNHLRRLKNIRNICQGLDVRNIISNQIYEGYGNCLICYGRGRINTTCKRDYCVNGKHNGYVMVFKNMEHQYINPHLIHTVMYLGARNVRVSRAVHESRNDSISVEVCLPIKANEHFNRAKGYFNCEYKVLWCAIMHGEDDTINLLHVMNEVLTVFEIIKETFIIKQMIRILIERAVLIEARTQWDKQQVTVRVYKIIKWITRQLGRSPRWVYNELQTEEGMAMLYECWKMMNDSRVLSVEQEELNRETTNEVQGIGNEPGGLDGDGRDREDKSEEERRVRPRRA